MNLKLTEGTALTLVTASMLKDVSVQMIKMPNFNANIDKIDFTMFGITSRDKTVDITINLEEKDFEKLKTNLDTSLAQLYNYVHKGLDIKPERLKNNDIAKSSMLLSLISTSKEESLANPMEGGDRLSKARATRHNFGDMLAQCDPISIESAMLFATQSYIYDIYENTRPVTGVMINKAIESNRKAYTDYQKNINDILSDIQDILDDEVDDMDYPDDDGMDC